VARGGLTGGSCGAGAAAERWGEASLDRTCSISSWIGLAGLLCTRGPNPAATSARSASAPLVSPLATSEPVSGSLAGFRCQGLRGGVVRDGGRGWGCLGGDQSRLLPSEQQLEVSLSELGSSETLLSLLRSVPEPGWLLARASTCGGEVRKQKWFHQSKSGFGKVLLFFFTTNVGSH